MPVYHVDWAVRISIYCVRTLVSKVVLYQALYQPHPSISLLTLITFINRWGLIKMSNANKVLPQKLITFGLHLILEGFCTDAPIKQEFKLFTWKKKCSLWGKSQHDLFLILDLIDNMSSLTYCLINWWHRLLHALWRCLLVFVVVRNINEKHEDMYT